MEHEEFKKNIYSYLSDELEDNDLENFEVHFFECLSCRDFLLSQKLAFSTLREYISTADISEQEIHLMIWKELLIILNTRNIPKNPFWIFITIQKMKKMELYLY